MTTTIRRTIAALVGILADTACSPDDQPEGG
jgi:hypothetical protein